MVFHYSSTDFQNNSQNAMVQTGPKQPGPTVLHGSGSVWLPRLLPRESMNRMAAAIIDNTWYFIYET